MGLADGVPIGLDPALQATFPALPPQSFGFLVPNSLGQLTLPFPASLVTLGLGFTPQLQSVYLNAGQPSPQGRRKMIYAATVRVTASGTFEVGANQTDASTVPPATFVEWTSGMSPPQLQFLDPPPPPTLPIAGRSDRAAALQQRRACADPGDPAQAWAGRGAAIVAAAVECDALRSGSAVR